MTTFQFNNKVGDANKGKIVVTYNNTSGSAKDFYYGVVGPTSTVKALTGTPDSSAVANGATVVLTVAIPLTSDGKLQAGVYVLTFKESAGAVQTYTHTYAGETTTTPTLKVDVDCLKRTMRFRDQSVYTYTGFTTTAVKTTTIQYPVIPGVVTPSDVVSTASDIQLAITHAGVSFSISYVANLTLSVVSGSFAIEELHTVSKALNQEIACNYNVCRLRKCVTEEIDRVAGVAAKKGGTGQLCAADQNILDLLPVYMQLVDYAFTCNDMDAAKLYFDKAKALITCDCGCGSNEITPLSDLFGGSTANAWTRIPDEKYNPGSGTAPTPSGSPTYPLKWRVDASNRLELEGNLRMLLPINLTGGTPVSLLTGYFSGAGVVMTGVKPFPKIVAVPLTGIRIWFDIVSGVETLKIVSDGTITSGTVDWPINVLFPLDS